MAKKGSNLIWNYRSFLSRWYTIGRYGVHTVTGWELVDIIS